ncbi:hypothetical protein ACFL3T_01200 [Patescibacteria group bacterium]
MTYKQNDRLSDSPDTAPLETPATRIDPAIAEQLLGYKTELDEFARCVFTSDKIMPAFDAIDRMVDLASGRTDASQFEIVIKSLITQLKIVKVFQRSAQESRCSTIISELESLVISD